MEWGKDVEFLEKRKEAGQSAKALDHMPELYEDLEEIWSIFWKLNLCRQSSFGPCPILAQEIQAVFDLYQIDTEERIEYFELIKAMDNCWLKYFSENRK